jgi:hypothetical protein
VPADYRKLLVSIRRPEAVIRACRSNLDIQQANRQSSVLNLAFNTSYPTKGRDFLNTLIEEYNNQAIEDKNMEALNTQKFINERIAIIDRELSEAELSVEEYKRSQGLTDLQADLARTMQMSSQYEQQLVEVESQLSIVKSLRDYVNDPANADKSIPVNIGIEDPTLNATISEYNRLLLQRQRLAQSVTPDNPVMRKLEDEIAGLRAAINSSINSVLEGLATRRKDLMNQANLYSGRIGSMPTQEREFLDLSREQQIKANLFLMLLQKREENALALAAVANKAKVLDEATVEGKVAPRTPMILAAALLLGFAAAGSHHLCGEFVSIPHRVACRRGEDREGAVAGRNSAIRGRGREYCHFERRPQQHCRSVSHVAYQPDAGAGRRQKGGGVYFDRVGRRENVCGHQYGAEPCAAQQEGVDCGARPAHSARTAVFACGGQRRDYQLSVGDWKPISTSWWCRRASRVSGRVARVPYRPIRPNC